MAKRQSQRKQRQSERAEEQERRAPVQPMTGGQEDYLDALKDDSVTVTVAFGPAGTGKTFVASSYSADLMDWGTIDRVIVTRPAVEAGGEQHGFLPGSIAKKTEPWARPVIEVFQKKFGANKVKAMMDPQQDGGPSLEFRPIAYMRGATLENAFVIVDEAQNLTPAQMRMLMTRIGENTKVAVAGDIEQTDLGRHSGLAEFLHVMDNHSDTDRIAIVEFTTDDVVRSGWCKDVLLAYHAADKAKAQERRREDSREGLDRYLAHER